MALIALGAVCGIVGGTVVSWFTFGSSGKKDEPHHDQKINAEGAINNVIVTDIKDKIEVEHEVKIILYILCTIKVIALIYFIYRHCVKRCKKRYQQKDRANNDANV